MNPAQHQTALAGSPVLVGAATVLCALVAVFLSYNANNGLPFVPTYDMTVQVPDAAGLVRGNEVRIGGKRVGVIEKIGAEYTEEGDLYSTLEVVAAHDARAAAGGHAGHGAAALAARPQVPRAEAGRLGGGDRRGRTAAAAQAPADRRARRGAQRVRRADSRRACATCSASWRRPSPAAGMDVNALLAESPELFGGVERVARNLSDPDTRLHPLPAAPPTTSRGELASVSSGPPPRVTGSDTTAGALDSVRRRAERSDR